MALCPVCNKRASKRFCPALRTKICAVCCAEKRMIELACPESCQYLRAGRLQAAERERELHTKEVAEGKFKPQITERHLPALYAIDEAIISAQRDRGARLSDLTDAEALAAVETTIKNLETEESGLIYEHRAPSLRVEEVSRRIRAELEGVNKEMTGDDRLRRGDMIKVLSFARDSIKTYMRRAGAEQVSSRSYIRYVSLFIPWPEEATKPLII
jgi:hypothetical protein